MLTEIIKVKGDWEEVVNDCRMTVGKGSLGREPSKEWKKAALISEHDPIRDIVIKFRWVMKYWTAMHWKTHIWRARTNTQRNDRQDNYDRNKAPQDTLVVFVGDPNIQHLIDTMRKRLCYMADPETVMYARDLKTAIREVEPEVSNVLVPNCIYRCGCPENGKCKFYKDALKKHPKLASTDIQERYDEYNRIFYGED